MSLSRTVIRRFETLHVPVIVAINSVPLSGETEILLAADLRGATPHAQISMPEMRLRIITGWEGYKRLVRDVGVSSGPCSW